MVCPICNVIASVTPPIVSSVMTGSPINWLAIAIAIISTIIIILLTNAIHI